MRTTALLVCALAPFAVGNVLAGEPRGVQTSVISETSDVYIPCLGEVLTVNGIIEVRGHVFETTNGAVHVLDNWTISQFIKGLSSGREWLGKGVSPFQSNIKVDGSGVTQWISRIRWEPIAKGDPAVAYQNQFKVTVNANGELVVERLPYPGGEGFRCLPANK